MVAWTVRMRCLCKLVPLNNVTFNAQDYGASRISSNMTVTDALYYAAIDGRLSDLQTELRKGLCSINAATWVREIHSNTYHVQSNDIPYNISHYLLLIFYWTICYHHYKNYSLVIILLFTSYIIINYALYIVSWGYIYAGILLIYKYICTETYELI